MTIKGSCHCGNTQFEVSEAPHGVTRCTCSLCAKRGALWAYYTPAQFRLTTGAVSPDHRDRGGCDLSMGQPHGKAPFLCQLRVRDLLRVAGLVDRKT
jgi:hypothetical protein